MSHNPLQLIVILCLAVLYTLASGCSQVSIAYNSADFLLEKYAKDYLALGHSEIASWRPALERALARHRREDLPYLARFFDSAHEGAVKTFDERLMRCLLDQFEDLLRRHMRLGVDLAVPLLAQLTPDQVRALDDKFRKEKAADEADMASASATRRLRKRAERYQESIAWWIGPLSKRQQGIVAEQTAAMPDTAIDWIAYRTKKRNALVDLLKRRAGEVELERFLSVWLVQHQDLPSNLRKARVAMRDAISALFIRMDKTYSPKQRAHFADRLAGMRDDFLSLQQQPRMATVRCAGAG